MEEPLSETPEFATSQETPQPENQPNPTVSKKRAQKENAAVDVVLTDADIRIDSQSIPWLEIASYRMLTRLGKLEILSTTGRRMLIPKNARVFYSTYPLSLGGDPFPFIVSRIQERSPSAQMKTVSDSELLSLLIVLNAEFFAVILSFALKINLGLMMMLAAFLGLAAGLGIPRLRDMNLVRFLPQKKR